MKRVWLVGFSSASCKQCGGPSVGPWVVVVNRRIVRTKFSRRPKNSLNWFTLTKIPKLNLFPAAADLRWPLSIYGPLYILEPRIKTLNKFPISPESRGDLMEEYLMGERRTHVEYCCSNCFNIWPNLQMVSGKPQLILQAWGEVSYIGLQYRCKCTLILQQEKCADKFLLMHKEKKNYKLYER